MVCAAIMSCLCCFWPPGIFAIEAACKAENAAAREDAIEILKMRSKEKCKYLNERKDVKYGTALWPHLAPGDYWN
uniref:Uncharacterized protein n=1 Tax=Magallana gigas TaxID=29159 RepID=K1PFK9_MAGGI